MTLLENSFEDSEGKKVNPSDLRGMWQVDNEAYQATVFIPVSKDYTSTFISGKNLEMAPVTREDISRKQQQEINKPRVITNFN